MSQIKVPSLSGAVGVSPRPTKGAKVKNNAKDVKLAQTLLAATGEKVKPDGRASDALIKAIKNFQKKSCGFKNPDGIIDVGGKTFKKLSSVAVKKSKGMLDLDGKGAKAKKDAKSKDAKGKDAKGKGKGGEAKGKPLNVKHNVPTYKKPQFLSQWAPCIGMMVTWKRGKRMDTDSMKEVLGYRQDFKQMGISPEDLNMFKKWGLRWAAPKKYTAEELAMLLKSRGPIWVPAGGSKNSSDVRIITAIKSDGTARKTMVSMHSPSGSVLTRTFEDFCRPLGGTGDDKMSMKKGIPVAHF